MEKRMRKKLEAHADVDEDDLVREVGPIVESTASVGSFVFWRQQRGEFDGGNSVGRLFLLLF
jgi:hypothetical protein